MMKEKVFRRPGVSMFVIILFLIVNSSMISAQTYIGVGTGLTYNKFNASENRNNKVTLDYKLGSSLSLFIFHCLSESIGIIIEPSLIQKNNIKISPYNGVVKETVYNSYLQLSAKPRLTVVKINRHSISTDIGPYIGYWLESIEEASLPNILNIQYNNSGQAYVEAVKIRKRNQFNRDKDNRFDAGLNISVGDFITFNRSLCDFRFSFCQSFVDIQKKYMLKQSSKINHSFNFNISYAFKIN